MDTMHLIYRLVLFGSDGSAFFLLAARIIMFCLKKSFLDFRISKEEEFSGPYRLS